MRVADWVTAMRLKYVQIDTREFLIECLTMDADEVGAYLLLLLKLANNPERKLLATDHEALARVTHTSNVQWKRIADQVLSHFSIKKDVITCPMISDQFAKQSYISAQRCKAGKAKKKNKLLMEDNVQW
ncbi:MAG: hypothetical protein CMM93_08110 [Rickettsiales bacterium]|nr:hypothetical protein [Rickettsiales bacterium]